MENRKDLKHLKETTENIERKLDKFIDCADKKFAPRWCADVIKFTLASGAVIIIGTFFSLILIK